MVAVEKDQLLLLWFAVALFLHIQKHEKLPKLIQKAQFLHLIFQPQEVQHHITIENYDHGYYQPCATRVKQGKKQAMVS